MAKLRIETEIVNAIIFDLDDRRGIGHEWRRIDPQTRRQIKAEWKAIVRKRLKAAKAKGATDGEA